MKAPKVSVGLPVYNGERYVRATLEGLLAQSFTDLEIIASDNASTDSTAEILAEFARRDRRIAVHRFSSNQGPVANYNKVAELARGEYFMWAAADDAHAPTFVSRCAEVLDHDPTVVIAHGETSIIDEQGAVMRAYDYAPNIDSTDIAERFHELITVDHRRHGAFEIFGLMRAAQLRETLPQGNYARADSVNLARMALRGRFVRLPETLFFNRDHADRSVRSAPTRSFHGRGILVGKLGAGPIPADEWWDASRRNQPVWPEWKLLTEYSHAVRDAPLDDHERAQCRRVLHRFAAHHTLKLARDVALNSELQLRRLVGGRSKRTPTEPHYPMTAPTETLIESPQAQALH